MLNSLRLSVSSFLTSPTRFQVEKPWSPDAVLASYGDTPDALIAAHVLRTLADDFTSWVSENPTNVYEIGQIVDNCPYNIEINLHNKSKSLIVKGRITFEYKYDFKRDKTCRYKILAVKPRNLTINAVEISSKFLLGIVDTYCILKKQHDDLVSAAKQAEDAMLSNEKKWTLAETLLKMKRNEHGALIPID